MIAAIEMLQAREIGFWGANVPPLEVLVNALDDPENGWFAACLLDTLQKSGAFTKIVFSVNDKLAKQIQMKADYTRAYPWVEDVLKKLSLWAKADNNQPPHVTSK
ncbi:MAG TPA: hypothetical protein VG815_14080 [Chloroflexota bacterium]|nr:hypothetical protein [Chloroflexota bacterium]